MIKLCLEPSNILNESMQFWVVKVIKINAHSRVYWSFLDNLSEYLCYKKIHFKIGKLKFYKVILHLWNSTESVIIFWLLAEGRGSGVRVVSGRVEGSLERRLFFFTRFGPFFVFLPKSGLVRVAYWELGVSCFEIG